MRMATTTLESGLAFELLENLKWGTSILKPSDPPHESRGLLHS
jgi:hypothetical protein